MKESHIHFIEADVTLCCDFSAYIQKIFKDVLKKFKIYLISCIELKIVKVDTIFFARVSMYKLNDLWKNLNYDNEMQ